MTRLTNEIRDAIIRKATGNLPQHDFYGEARAVIEGAIYSTAPQKVRAIMDDAKLRSALAESYIEVKVGNRSVFFFGNQNGFLGIVDPRARRRSRPITIYMDDATLNDVNFAAIKSALEKSGVVARAIAAMDTLESVKRRLKSAVYSVTTVKRLYDVLEPELHHLIPKDVPGASLPVVSVNVAEDLRKLGADLPHVKANEPVK